jgi:glycosyltransferase involved in cell wall biosynthesis
MSKPLKIAFIVRSTINLIKGGDSLQVIHTAAELIKLGINVEIKLSNESINYQKYDLLHLFNIIRPSDHLKHITKSKVPYVVSTIYLDYSEFDKKGRNTLQNQLFALFGRDVSEFLKNNYRYIRKQDKLVSIEYLLGHAKAIKKILSNARLLLPNSSSEYNRLKLDYGVNTKYHVVPNGIDKELFSVIPKVTRLDNQVVSVGQIYGLKNQYRLIQACKKLNVKLVIIGKSPPNHISYYKECRQIADSSIQFHGFLPQHQLLNYYASSKVHALPSWFETTGLSSLEAGAMGCNLVVGSGGDTIDYYNNHASFCRSDDIKSIEDALQTELNKKTTFDFREYILENYTWEKAAKETLIAYKKALDID